MGGDIPLLLVGGGGHCRAVIDVVEREGRFRIAGIVDVPERQHQSLDGHPIIGTDADLPDIVRTVRHAIVAVGQIKSPDLRRRLYERLLAIGFELPRIVSPTAVVSPRATIGHGTVVMHRVVVNAGAVIGDNCIVNTGAIVEHDCRVGADVHLAIGSLLCGEVTVGSGSFVGAGAVCREGVIIGENAIVGMGARVKSSLPAGSIFPGT